MKNTQKLSSLTVQPIFARTYLTSLLFPDVKPLFGNRDEIFINSEVPALKILDEVLKHKGKSIVFDTDCRDTFFYLFEGVIKITDNDLSLHGLKLSDFSKLKKLGDCYDCVDSRKIIAEVFLEKFSIVIPTGDRDTIEKIIDELANDQLSFEANAKAVKEITAEKNFAPITELYLFVKMSEMCFSNSYYDDDNSKLNSRFRSKQESVIAVLEKEFGMPVVLIDNFDVVERIWRNPGIQIVFGYLGEYLSESAKKVEKDYHRFRWAYKGNITYWNLWHEFHNGQDNVKFRDKRTYGETFIAEARKLFAR